jgi:hypothetical protein
MLSFIISLMSSSQASVVETLEAVVGMVIFCSYCVVFYAPLITCYEEVTVCFFLIPAKFQLITFQGIKFNQSFSRLSNALLPISRTATVNINDL